MNLLKSKKKDQKNQTFFKRKSEIDNAKEANTIQWLNFKYSRHNRLIRKTIITLVIGIMIYVQLILIIGINNLKDTSYKAYIYQEQSNCPLDTVTKNDAQFD